MRVTPIPFCDATSWSSVMAGCADVAPDVDPVEDADAFAVTAGAIGQITSPNGL